MSEKKTITISVRVKPTTLATLANFMEHNGVLLSNRGQVISACLDQKCEEIRQTFGTSFPTESSALEFLVSRDFLGNAKVNQRKIFDIRSNDSAKSSMQSVYFPGQPQKREFDQLAAFREVIRNLIAMGQEPDAEQLRLAQMVKTPDGQFVELSASTWEQRDQGRLSTQQALALQDSPEPLNECSFVETKKGIAGPVPAVK